MSEEEVGFDNWQEEADKIVTSQAKEEESKATLGSKETVKQNPEQHVDAYEHHLRLIQRMKNMSASQFQAEFVSKDIDQTRRIEPFTALLKAQKQFVELACALGGRFRAEAKQSPEKVLPQVETVGFFQQLLLYLYGEWEWESIESVKEKTKIVKKEKKEEEAKVKKLREKEMRLRRGFNNKQDNNQKQPDIVKAQPVQQHPDEGM